MPSASTLPENITKTLEESLEEFRDADRKQRKAIIKREAQNTLPAGGNVQQHKQVGLLYPLI